MSSGGTSADQRRAFERWLAEDVRHEEAYDRAETLVQALAHLDAQSLSVSTSRHDAGFVHGLRRVISRVVRKPAFQLAVAAVTIIGITLGVMETRPARNSGDSQPQTSVESLTYATQRAEFLEIELADGTQATLGPGTTLKVQMGSDRRHLNLIEGDVFVDAATDYNRPFIIQAGDLFARALGTQYEVKYSADIIRVGVAEGTVEVSAPFRLDGEETGLMAKRELTEGDRVVVSSSGMKALPSSSIDSIATWRGGRLEYLDASLLEVVSDLNRYSTTPIRLDDPARRLEQATLTASVDIENVDRLLSRMPRILPVIVDQNDPQESIIRPSPEP